MKKCKNLFVLGASVLVAMSLTACGGGGTTEDTRVADVIAEAQTLSTDELYAKAREEINGKTFTVVANSSRMKDAAPAWMTAMQEIDSSFSFEFKTSQPKNNQIFTQIKSDVTGSNHVISMTLIQDGSQIKSKMTSTGYLLNYIPKEWDGDKSKDGEPLALQSLSKVFCYNTNGEDGTEHANDGKFTNVFDFVLHDNKTQFMSPSSEPVGQNFLYMLTQEKYAAYVKTAYDALSSEDKATVDETIADSNSGITALMTEGGFTENAKYSLAWIYLFLKSYTPVTDDGPIANNLVAKGSGGASGLLVYSKFRSTQESDTVSNKYIQVAAYDDNYVGFGGYMYKHYLQILKTSPYPWTSCALIHWMVTDSRGFQPWGKDMGGYSSSPTVQSAFDHSNDGGTEFPVKNDKGYDWWTGSGKGKGNLVVEDGEYASSVSTVMAEWMAYLK